MIGLESPLCSCHEHLELDADSPALRGTGASRHHAGVPDSDANSRLALATSWPKASTGTGPFGPRRSHWRPPPATSRKSLAVERRLRATFWRRAAHRRAAAQGRHRWAARWRPGDGAFSGRFVFPVAAALRLSRASPQLRSQASSRRTSRAFGATRAPCASWVRYLYQRAEALIGPERMRVWGF